MIDFDVSLSATAGFVTLDGILRGFLGFGGSMGAVPGISFI